MRVVPHFSTTRCIAKERSNRNGDRAQSSRMNACNIRVAFLLYINSTLSKNLLQILLLISRSIIVRYGSSTCLCSRKRE